MCGSSSVKVRRIMLRSSGTCQGRKTESACAKFENGPTREKYAVSEIDRNHRSQANRLSKLKLVF